MINCTYCITLSGVGITLIVQNTSVSVLEGDPGNTTIQSIFVMANITQPLGRLAVFQFTLTSATTAMLGEDFILQNTEITIPFNFAGIFSTSITVVILGDDSDEMDIEVIEGILEPISDLDTVLPSGVITINITDDEGELRRPSAGCCSYVANYPTCMHHSFYS